jgi:transglutaminase-like putative cysteine protease
MFLRLARQPAFTLESIPDGVAGITETLKRMTALVREYKTDETIYRQARELTRGSLQKDFYGEIAALFDFVQNHIRYVGDVTDVESVQSPTFTLQIGSGDCDDKAVLLAALLESINHPTKFIAVGFSPDSIEHVYIETRLGTRWIALDPTEPNEVGWKPPMIKNRIERFN